MQETRFHSCETRTALVLAPALPPARPRVLSFALELAMGSPLALALRHAHALALAPTLPPARPRVLAFALGSVITSMSSPRPVDTV